MQSFSLIVSSVSFWSLAVTHATQRNMLNDICDKPEDADHQTLKSDFNLTLAHWVRKIYLTWQLKPQAQRSIPKGFGKALRKAS
jgi:hypothetical protein